LRRLLKEDAAAREEYMKYHKLRDDPRVTRVVRLLRKSSLDELPQLWNVLRGDMGEILRVLPRITGPWQVSGRNGTSFAQRVNMDARCVRDWSVWLDLVLLFPSAPSGAS
jgi:lipopolysaccharide/colanic/teichoic acid biosynthesis glycosyltransferase